MAGLSATIVRSSSASTYAVDLTAKGGADYIVANSRTTYKRKDVTSLFGTVVKTWSFSDNDKNPSGYTVTGTDGKPSPATFSITTLYGGYIEAGQYWEITAPAGLAERTLQAVVFSDFGPSFQVQATLSDGSVSPLTLDRNTNGTGSGNYGLYELDYSAGSDGQTVTIRITGSGGQINIGWLWLSEEASSGLSVALTGIGNTYSAGSLSGSVNKALTGSAQTASQGTLVKVHSKALTNNAINASQGALASAIAFALTGQAFTYTQGTVTPDATSNINVALTGQQYAFAQGNVTASTIKALTGQQATETAGNLAKSISKAITGQGSTFALGSLGSSVTTPLIGGSSVYSQGSVSPTGTVNIQLTGSTFTYSAGTLTASSSKAITGQSATVSQGTLAGLIARALSGQGQTLLQGTVTPSNAIQVQLTGQQASYSQGFLTASLSKQLIGSVATYRQGTLSVFGQVIPQYPLEGAVITYPISASVDYPLAGNNPNYPLGT